MSNTRTKVSSWPRDRLDPTKRYRAVQSGLIYELRPARQRGYWWAAIKRGNRKLKWLWKPLREAELFRLFHHGFSLWICGYHL